MMFFTVIGMIATAGVVGFVLFLLGAILWEIIKSIAQTVFIFRMNEKYKVGNNWNPWVIVKQIWWLTMTAGKVSMNPRGTQVWIEVPRGFGKKEVA
jgi:hypothetical protein